MQVCRIYIYKSTNQIWVHLYCTSLKANKLYSPVNRDGFIWVGGCQQPLHSTVQLCHSVLFLNIFISIFRDRIIWKSQFEKVVSQRCLLCHQQKAHVSAEQHALGFEGELTAWCPSGARGNWSGRALSALPEATRSFENLGVGNAGVTGAAQQPQATAGHHIVQSFS